MCLISKLILTNTCGFPNSLGFLIDSLKSQCSDMRPTACSLCIFIFKTLIKLSSHYESPLQSHRYELIFAIKVRISSNSYFCPIRLESSRMTSSYFNFYFIKRPSPLNGISHIQIRSSISMAVPYSGKAL